MIAIAFVSGVLLWSLVLGIVGLELYFFLTILLPAVIGLALALLTSFAVFALPCIWVLKRALSGTAGAVTGMAKAVAPVVGLFAAGKVGAAAIEHLGEHTGKKPRKSRARAEGPHVPPPPMAPIM